MGRKKAGRFLVNPAGVIFNGRFFAGGGRLSGGFHSAAGRSAKNAGVVRRDAAFADEAWRRQAVTYPLVDWGLNDEADAKKGNVRKRFFLRLRAPPGFSARCWQTGG